MPNGPLRMVGEHVVALHLHADIDVPLTVLIVAEE
jgi:ribosomal protein L9